MARRGGRCRKLQASLRKLSCTHLHGLSDAIQAHLFPASKPQDSNEPALRKVLRVRPATRLSTTSAAPATSLRLPPPSCVIKVRHRHQGRKVLLAATNQDTDKVDTSLLKEYVASEAYDLWSFGVVLYHLCFGRPLWLTDINDNVTPEDLRTLAAGGEPLRKALRSTRRSRKGTCATRRSTSRRRMLCCSSCSSLTPRSAWRFSTSSSRRWRAYLLPDGGRNMPHHADAHRH